VKIAIVPKAIIGIIFFFIFVYFSSKITKLIPINKESLFIELLFLMFQIIYLFDYFILIDIYNVQQFDLSLFCTLMNY